MAWLALEALEDDVQDAVRVEIEVADDGLNDLYDVRWHNGGEILVEFSNQLRVSLAFLAEQVEFLLLVAVMWVVQFDTLCFFF